MPTNGYQIFGESIADAIKEYHKRHVQYDEKMGTLQSLADVGYTEDGRIMSMAAAKEAGQKVKPVIDQKLVQQYQARTHGERERNAGALDMLTRMGIHTLGQQVNKAISDQSVSSQRTQQVMEQDKEMFPLDIEAKKASIAHVKKVTGEEGKTMVPGYGMMTPTQLSAHNARMERMDVLKKKSEPLLLFENALQSKYGLGIKDVAEAKSALGNNYKAAYFNANGDQVGPKEASENPEGTFVMVGPNKVPVPILDKKGGLGWGQIAPKAVSFFKRQQELEPEARSVKDDNDKVQAQQVLDAAKNIDMSKLAPEDLATIEQAKAVLGVK